MPKKLTSTQAQIVDYLRENPGADNYEVAHAVHLAPQSVKRHFKAIYDQLGLIGNGKAKRQSLVEWIEGNDR